MCLAIETRVADGTGGWCCARRVGPTRQGNPKFMQALIDCGLLDDTPRADLAPETAPIAWVREMPTMCVLSAAWLTTFGKAMRDGPFHPARPDGPAVGHHQRHQVRRVQPGRTVLKFGMTDLLWALLLLF